MNEYIYPALFHANSDGSYTVTFPDLPGCISEGKSLGDALRMAESALSQWLGYLSDKGQRIPAAGNAQDIRAADGWFVTLIRADAGEKRAALISG